MAWPTFTTITPLTEYDSNQTLSVHTMYALVDASNIESTITLSAVTNTRSVHVIKKIDSTPNKVIVKGDDITIDGEDQIELLNQYAYVKVISDGTEWWIIGGINVKLETVLVDLLDEQEKTNSYIVELIAELQGVKDKIDRWSAMQYSDFHGEINQ